MFRRFFPRLSPSLRGALSAAVSLVLVCSSAAGGRGPKSKQKHAASPEVIDLNKAIAIALQNNFGVSVRRLEKASAAEDIEVARAAYDPNFSATAARNVDARIGGVSAGELSGYNAVISERVGSGATIELSANTAKTDNSFAFDQTSPYESDLHLNLRQPLLKGGGFAFNRSPILLGRIGVKEADFELQKSVLDLLRDVEIAYWDVVFAYQEKEVRQATVSVAERLLSETSGRGQVGLTTGVEPLQARAAVTARFEAVIVAQQAIEDRTDKLMLLMGKLGQSEYRVRVPVETPSFSNPKISDDKMRRMIEQLPDYRQYESLLHRRQILVDRARNDALPILDVTVGTGYTGFGHGYLNAYGQAFRNDQRDYQALVEMRFPFGLRAERATLRKRQAEMQIDELRKREAEQVLRARIREAARAVAAGNERVKVTSDSLNLNNQQFEQLTAKFREGLTSFRDMLLVQDELQEANARAVRAKLEAVEAGIRLARFDGSLLARYGLGWDSPGKNPKK